MRVWTDYMVRPQEDGGFRFPPTELARVTLKAIALVVVVFVSVDAGAASEAQRTLDALAREHEADVRTHYAVGLLRRFVPAGEDALEVCLSIGAEFRASPIFRRADDGPQVGTN